MVPTHLPREVGVVPRPFTGGRPAMISAATGAIALVIAPLVRDHGVEYLVAAVLLGGTFQVALACSGWRR
jgi:sulfate permease, SulP family